MATCLAVASFAVGVTASAEGPVSFMDGFHATPKLGWTRGDHSFELDLMSRWRYEHWQVRAPDSSDFNALRTSFGLRYTWRDTISLYAQGQDMRIWGLDAMSSGAAAAYRAFSRNQSDPAAIRLRQLYLGLNGGWGNLKAGRQDVGFGDGPAYAESPNWKWLRKSRLGERLIGNVGWSHAARSYDGVDARIMPVEGHFFEALAVQPTTGVFDIEGSYERQKQITTGGVEWVATPDSLIPGTEFGSFFLAYADDRDPDKVAGLFGEILVFTMGASAMGIYPMGPGEFDMLLWGAFQFGRYTDLTTTRGVKKLDQFAGAGIAEFGYRLPDIYGKPWFRAGLNIASGDGDPDDGDHNTFFNMLPTNHKFYGYMDQFAFQNLIDLLAQIRWDAHKYLKLELMVHRFWLVDDNDGRYFGTGAFSRKNLGFGSTPSQGSNDVGTEIDLTATVPIHRTLSLQAGYSYLWGGDVFKGTPNDADGEWAYVQLQFKY